MAKVEEFEKQHEAAKDSRKNWVHQPGTEDWDKLTKELAFAGVFQIMRTIVKVEDGAEMLLKLQLDYMRAKIAYEIGVESFLITLPPAVRNEQAEVVKPMMEESDAICASAIEKGKEMLRVERRRQGKL